MLPLPKRAAGRGGRQQWGSGTKEEMAAGRGKEQHGELEERRGRGWLERKQVMRERGKWW